MAPVAGLARIVELNQAAAAFYAEQYPSTRAADYVTARFGSDLSQTDRISIGYAPAGWDSLTQHLRTVCAATNDELIDAGLAKYSQRGTLNLKRAPSTRSPGLNRSSENRVAGATTGPIETIAIHMGASIAGSVSWVVCGSSRRRRRTHRERRHATKPGSGANPQAAQ